LADVLKNSVCELEASMTDSELRILTKEGEQGPGPAEFKYQIAFYKETMRTTRIVIALIACLLLAMYFFLVR
jgi:hypothetical protein